MLTRDEFERLSDETVPEIKRCNLTNVIMQVKYVSVSEILKATLIGIIFIFCCISNVI